MKNSKMCQLVPDEKAESLMVQLGAEHGIIQNRRWNEMDWNGIRTSIYTNSILDVAHGFYRKIYMYSDN